MVPLCTVLLALISDGDRNDGSLQIANARATFGHLGPTRGPGPRYPGETVYFSFDIVNLKLDKNGRANYVSTVEVFDDKNSLISRLGPTHGTARNFLGGNSLPCSAHLDIPLDAPPGEYLLRVTIKDCSSDKAVSLERKAKLDALNFALVNVGTFADREGKVAAPAIGVTGETIYVRFAAIGFARKKDGQPDVEVAMRVLDDKGRPTFSKALPGHVNSDVPQDMKMLDMQFPLTLSRPGSFTIELSGTCKVSNETFKVSMPLRVFAFRGST